MEKTVITFGDIEIQKQKFHQRKRRISIKNVNIDKKVASNKAPLGRRGFEYFIGDKDPKKIKALCIFFPKISEYTKDFDER